MKFCSFKAIIDILRWQLKSNSPLWELNSSCAHTACKQNVNCVLMDSISAPSFMRLMK